MPSQHQQKADELEKELSEFFASCKKQAFSAAEMRQICRPLLWQKHLDRLKWGALLVTPLIAFWLLYQWCDAFSWTVSAVGRLVLIQLLPYWNWTPLYNSKCLWVRDSQDSKEMSGGTSKGAEIDKRFETNADNCALCEMLERLPTASNVSYSYLEFNFLERGLPVIVTDSHTPHSLASFLTQMLSASPDFLESSPCDVASNLLLPKLFNLEQALEKINTSSALDKWFLQLRNCQRRAVKASRLFVTRPYYYPLHMEPFYSSWVLMSQNYPTKQLREIYLHGLVFVQQLSGHFDVRLRPKKPCHEICPAIVVRLSAGECLVFPTDLWSFSYGNEEANGKETSIATVLEIDWQF